MQVFIETTSGLERRLTVGVPAERVDEEVNSRLKKAARNVRLDGFRPGKVPLKVIKQRFGADVRHEVLGEVMSQSFHEAVTQENLKPAGQPSIEPKTLEEGRDLEFIATFEVFPEIELADLTGIEISRPQATVTVADIDNMIDIFRKQQGGWEAVERAAAEGDKVNIDYRGTRDGEPFEDGSAEGTDLELGSGRMIAGFEDGIVGMCDGEEKTLALGFPADYHNEDLRGAAVQFAIKLNSTSEQVPAPMDEELFGKYGVEGGGEEQFRREIADNMQRELNNAIKSRVKTQIMDAVVDAHKSQEVPRALIEREIDTMRKQMFQQFGGAGSEDLDIQSLLPADMFQEQAERRVKLGLILNEIIARRELKADADKVKASIEEIASTYQEPEQVVQWYYSNQEQLQSVELMVLEDQVVDGLLEAATINDEACSYQDAIAQAQESQKT